MKRATSPRQEVKISSVRDYLINTQIGILVQFKVFVEDRQMFGERKSSDLTSKSAKMLTPASQDLRFTI